MSFITNHICVNGLESLHLVPRFNTDVLKIHDHFRHEFTNSCKVIIGNKGGISEQEQKS